jgi:small subunit ribosomal protein S13
MARIAGINIPEGKKVKIAMTYVHGIGQVTALKILAEAGVDPEKRAKDLTTGEEDRIRDVINGKYEVEGELRQKIFRNIKRLKEIKAYRGLRHRLGLPVRGQRTRTNAHTRKGKNIAVGGLKHKLEKT